MSTFEYNVSIIIPCFNAEKTIIRTLKSIESQSMGNYQVVMIDDGSTDNTEKIIKKYIKDKNDYLYIKQKNSGVSAARNRGLEKAKGKYISFLDADDVYHPKFLEILCNEIENNSVDIVCSKYKWININETIGEDSTDDMKSVRLSNREIIERYMRKRKYMFSFWNCLYKHEIIDEQKIKFDTELAYGEDSLFLGQYLANCYNGGIFVESTLYGYTKNENSAMHKKVTWKNTDNIEAMKKIVDYWEKTGLDTSFSDYMISRAVWGIAKDFAVDDELFEKLSETYDVKRAMKILSKKCCEIVVKISVFLAKYNMNIFKGIMKMFYK